MSKLQFLVLSTLVVTTDVNVDFKSGLLSSRACAWKKSSISARIEKRFGVFLCFDSDLTPKPCFAKVHCVYQCPVLPLGSILVLVFLVFGVEQMAAFLAEDPSDCVPITL